MTWPGADRLDLCQIQTNAEMRVTSALLLAAISLAAPNSSAVAENKPCRAMEHERSEYTVCEIDLRQQTIRLYWKRPDGTPYAYLSALPRPLEGEAGKMLLATNDVLSPGSTNADRSRNPANGLSTCSTSLTSRLRRAAEQLARALAQWQNHFRLGSGIDYSPLA